MIFTRLLGFTEGYVNVSLELGFFPRSRFSSYDFSCFSYFAECLDEREESCLYVSRFGHIARRLPVECDV